ncbi:MAG: hypothetical protein VX438_01500, partial [Planctomycetota bacterium]|nr:hypothetical protein [Planctomycetota bacterium]
MTRRSLLLLIVLGILGAGEKGGKRTWAQNGVKLNTPILDGPSGRDSQPVLKPNLPGKPKPPLAKPTGLPIQRHFNSVENQRSGRGSTFQKFGNLQPVQGTAPVQAKNRQPEFRGSPQEVLTPNPEIPQFKRPRAGISSSPSVLMNQSAQGETIKERYSNGVVRVERQVILDSQKNYVNHGPWKYYLPSGRLSAQGFFQQGKKVGTWSRWITPTEVPLLKSALFKQFQSPFLTTFVYRDDEIDGIWKVVDSANRPVFEFSLKAGKRHSACTWFLPNGQKSQEVHYQEGLRQGEAQKWNAEGKLTEIRKYTEGHEIG